MSNAPRNHGSIAPPPPDPVLLVEVVVVVVVEVVVVVVDSSFKLKVLITDCDESSNRINELPVSVIAIWPS